MHNEFAGKRAVVTGAGRGIGAAIARSLAGSGVCVVLVGRTREPLDVLAAEIPNASVKVSDVVDPVAARVAFETIGDVDILVNNVGAVESAKFERSDDALWDRMLGANLRSTINCTRCVLPGMKARGYGRIVNVASTASLKGYPYVTAYCAAKHAILGLTRALAVEVERAGVTVNAVCPGYVDTELFSRSVQTIVEATGRSAEEVRNELLKDNPDGRLIRVEEVAAEVLWLCTSEVTGKAIGVPRGEAA